MDRGASKRAVGMLDYSEEVNEGNSVLYDL